MTSLGYVNWRREGFDPLESNWSLLNKFIHLNNVSARCTARFLFQAPVNSLCWDLRGWPSAAPAGFSAGALARLGLSSDVNRTMVATAFAPPLGPFDVLQLASDVLRYCPVCIQHGFHCALYQHRWLHRCPLHHVVLVERCAHCGAPLAYRLYSYPRMFVPPYGCASCGRLLWPTITQPRWSAPLGEDDRHVIRRFLVLGERIAQALQSSRAFHSPAMVGRDVGTPGERAEYVARALQLWMEHEARVGIDRRDLAAPLAHVIRFQWYRLPGRPGACGAACAPAGAGGIARREEIDTVLSAQIRQTFKAIRRHILKHIIPRHGACVQMLQHYVPERSPAAWLHGIEACHAASAFYVWNGFFEPLVLQRPGPFVSRNMAYRLLGPSSDPLRDAAGEAQMAALRARITIQWIWMSFAYLWDVERGVRERILAAAQLPGFQMYYPYTIMRRVDQGGPTRYEVTMVAGHCIRYRSLLRQAGEQTPRHRQRLRRVLLSLVHAHDGFLRAAHARLRR